MTPEELVECVKEFHQSAELMLEFATNFSYQLGIITQDAERRAELSPEKMTDIGYFLRDTERLLEEAAKECRWKRNSLGKLVCLHITKQAIEQDSKKLRCDGNHASAIPDIRMKATIPGVGTPERMSLLKRLGVQDKETITKGLVDPSYRRLCDFLTECAANGKQAPLELVEIQRADPNCTFRKKTTKQERRDRNKSPL